VVAWLLSFLGHVIVLGMVALLGAARPTAPRASVSVRLVAGAPEAQPAPPSPERATRARPEPRPPAPPEREPEPEPEPEPPAREPDIGLAPTRPDPPPAREKPPEPKPRRRPPEKKPVQVPTPAPTPAPADDPGAAPAAATTVPGTGISGRVDGLEGVADYYVQSLVREVSRAWLEPRSGRPGQSSVIVFELSRAGVVSGVEVEQSSGSSLFDRSAARAVQLADPLPPFPPDFRARSLRVHFEFIP